MTAYKKIPMVTTMKKRLCGVVAFAMIQLATAHAGPTDADLWIGFENSENGFLLDEATGETWMTGVCLKTLSAATQSGDVWTTQTVELVSVGRAMAQLDQTFRLDVNVNAPSVSVRSVGRGGEQSFPAVIDRDCGPSGTCGRLIQTQQACQG